MITDRSKTLQYYLDAAGIMCVSIFCLGYAVLKRHFAEWSIQLHFLDFPIFVGEILLFICLALFLTKYLLNPWKLTMWHYLVMGYFAFVVVKAFLGYFRWGPLGFRHAALFYYPMFAVLTFSFFRRDFFDSIKKALGVLAITTIFLVELFDIYWVLSLTCSGIILSRSIPDKRVKIPLLIFFLLFVPYRLFFYTSRMMMISNAACGVFIVLGLYLILRMNKILKISIAMCSILFISFGVIQLSDRNAIRSIVSFQALKERYDHYDNLIKEKGKNYRRTEMLEVQVFSPNHLEENRMKRMRDLRDDYVRLQVAQNTSNELAEAQKDAELKAQEVDVEQVLTDAHQKAMQEALSKEDESSIFELVDNAAKEVDLQEQTPVNQVSQVENIKTDVLLAQPVVKEVNGLDDEILMDNEVVIEQEVKQEIKETMASHEEVKNEKNADEKIVGTLDKLDKMTTVLQEEASLSLGGFHTHDFGLKRNYGVALNNVIFRILIWKDMIKDLREKKPLLGFDFGMPLRSTNLEILNWGWGEWFGVGWVSPHNSYLHIIYRAGFVGGVFILCILGISLRMIKQAIAGRSVTGILLCAMVINWFLAANFLIIFEMPYSAIPSWCIFGFTLAYCQSLASKNKMETTL